MGKQLRVRSEENTSPEPIKFRFSKRLIESLAAPSAGRVYYYDEATPGLALCITEADGRAFYFCYRADGRYRRFRIGGFPGVSVENAQKRAKELTGDVAKGVDPQAAKHERRAEPTLGEVFDYHLEQYAKPHKKTWKQDERTFKAYLSGWKSRRLNTIRTEDVQKLHTKLGEENGKYQANRVVELLRTLFVTAKKQLEWRGDNPVVDVKQFKERSRDRFLSAQEVPKLLRAIDDYPDAAWRNYFRLLLLTGVRRANALAARWEQIDWNRRVWRLPDTKSGGPVNVELAAAAVEVLESQRDLAGGSPWVFPANRSDAKVGHATQPDKAWKVICKAAGIENLRIHDLRRTLGSWQAIAGASQTVIGASLGHAPGSSATAIYSRLTQSAVRNSVETAVAAMLAAGKSKGGE